MYLIGTDLGTTSAKTGAFTANGDLISSASQNFSQQNGNTVETDPSKWWNAICNCLIHVTKNKALEKTAGISVGSQGPTVIALDEKNRPICPALMWMDLRAEEEARILSERLGKNISPAWFVPKVMWLKRNRPDLYKKSKCFVQAMDYVVYRLTRQIWTGVASNEIVPWKEEEISEGELDLSKFPEFRVMGDLVGYVTAEAANVTGVAEGTPVYSGAPDFVESILGTGTVKKGRICDRCGTSEGVDLCWDRKINDPRLYSKPHPVVPGMWHIGGTIATTGKSLDWAGEILFDQASTSELLQMAERSLPGSKGILYLPHLTGERNLLWGPHARGVFFGLRLSHKREDLIRAVLEGCAFSIQQILSVMTEGGAHLNEIRVTGSQATSSLWNQIKADITSLDVVAPKIAEGEILGAAIIAACGAGFYPDLKTAAEYMVEIGPHFHPREETRDMYESLCHLHRRLYTSLEKYYRELDEIVN
ncbi:MAG: xylulokinase [Methanotrichaceae archaeon]